MIVSLSFGTNAWKLKRKKNIPFKKEKKTVTDVGNNLPSTRVDIDIYIRNWNENENDQFEPFSYLFFRRCECKLKKKKEKLRTLKHAFLINAISCVV